MFKYLWIVALVILYILGWVHTIQNIMWVRTIFRKGCRFKYIDGFSIGWIVMHIAIPIIMSFFYFMETR